MLYKGETQTMPVVSTKLQMPKSAGIQATIQQVLRGYSSYEIAIQNGFEGTEEEWLDSLKGDGVENIRIIDGGNAEGNNI